MGRSATTTSVPGSNLENLLSERAVQRAKCRLCLIIPGTIGSDKTRSIFFLSNIGAKSRHQISDMQKYQGKLKEINNKNRSLQTLLNPSWILRFLPTGFQGIYRVILLDAITPIGRFGHTRYFFLINKRFSTP